MKTKPIMTCRLEQYEKADGSFCWQAVIESTNCREWKDMIGDFIVAGHSNMSRDEVMANARRNAGGHVQVSFVE